MLASQQQANDRLPHHATAPDAESSIERWRSELSAAEQEYCAQMYRKFFETFDYPLQ
jgi:hypothetical protein